MKLPEFISTVLRKYGIILVLILLIIISSFISPNFLTRVNILNLIKQVVVISLIACGGTLVLISGMVDLSPGSVIAFAGCIATSVMIITNSIYLAVLSGILVGAATGLINGFLISKFNLPAFIVTLAMMMSARGAVLIYTNITPIANIGNLTFLGQGYIWGIPVPIIILAIIALITWFILKLTKFGRHIYALGSNQTVARASGININRMKIQVFILNGIFVGIAGIVLMARMASGQPTAGEGYEFDALTAVIIGGTSLYGGIGNIQGTLVGALIIGVLNNILNLANVSSHYQQLLRGFIIIGAVLLDLQTKKNFRMLDKG
ncbi:MAG: ABC transporter permease [Actinobacteria bacterium]|nr:ABC transporter permease [Actinomycetota bacterium]